MNNAVDKFIDMVQESNNIVFFGGAGVSTESNIPDFRSKNGIYKTENKFAYPPEVMLSHNFFMNNTEEFFNFYKQKMIYKDAKPNDAHYALAYLEKIGKLKKVITQNIDGLHQLAGSKNVIELHGSVYRNYCMDCKKSFELSYLLKNDTNIPTCDVCGGIVKPDVVLYEESLDMNNISNAVDAVKSADMLIVGGTSLVVYPAANLIRYYNGNKLVLINKTETPYDNRASLVLHDSIGKILNKAINKLNY